MVAALCPQAAMQQAAKVGHNVTPEAQQIFNALAKTMPCTWRNRDIVVMTNVRHCAPSPLFTNKIRFIAYLAEMIFLQIPLLLCHTDRELRSSGCTDLGRAAGYMTHGSGRVGCLRSFRKSGPYMVVSFGIKVSAISSGLPSRIAEGVQVRVAPPYDLHSCSQTTDDPNLLARVQKVVRSAAPGTGCSCCPLP